MPREDIFADPCRLCQIWGVPSRTLVRSLLAYALATLVLVGGCGADTELPVSAHAVTDPVLGKTLRELSCAGLDRSHFLAELEAAVSGKAYPTFEELARTVLGHPYLKAGKLAEAGHYLLMYHSQSLQAAPRALSFRADGQAFVALSATGLAIELLSFDCERGRYLPVVIQWGSADKRAHWFGGSDSYSSLLEAGFDTSKVEGLEAQGRLVTKAGMTMGRLCQACHGNHAEAAYQPESLHPNWAPYGALWPGAYASHHYEDIFSVFGLSVNPQAERTNQVWSLESAFYRKMTEEPGHLGVLSGRPARPDTWGSSMNGPISQGNSRRIAVQLVAAMRSLPIEKQRSLIDAVLPIESLSDFDGVLPFQLNDFGAKLEAVCQGSMACSASQDGFHQYLYGDGKGAVGQIAARVEAGVKRTLETMSAVQTTALGYGFDIKTLPSRNAVAVERLMRELPLGPVDRWTYRGRKRGRLAELARSMKASLFRSAAIGYLGQAFDLDWRHWVTTPSYWSESLSETPVDFHTGEEYRQPGSFLYELFRMLEAYRPQAREVSPAGAEPCS